MAEAPVSAPAIASRRWRLPAFLTRTFPSVGGHFAALDGLRGIALLLVVCSHASLVGVHLVPGVDMSGTGKAGVWLFFVLSAFLLMHQCLQLDAAGRLDGAAWWRYAWRRVLRIYPLYTVFLLACWLAPVAHYMPPMSGERVLAHLAVREGAWLTWSIAVELKYYLVLPLLALAYIHVARRSLVAATLLVVAAIIGHGLSRPVFAVDGLWTYFTIFLVGSWVAVAHHHLARHPRLRQRLAPACAAATVALSVLVVVLTPSLWGRLWGVEVPIDHWHRAFTLFALLWGGLLLCLLQAPGAVQRVFAAPPLRLVGVVSFSGYLWHGILLADLAWLPFPEGSYARAAGLLLGVLLVSIASYVVIERPFLRIGRRRVDAADGIPVAASQRP